MRPPPPREFVKVGPISRVLDEKLPLLKLPQLLLDEKLPLLKLPQLLLLHEPQLLLLHEPFRRIGTAAAGAPAGPLPGSLPESPQ